MRPYIYIFLLCAAYSYFLPLPALADDFGIPAPNSLAISASWNDTSLPNAVTTTLPLGQPGILSWNSSYNASNTQLSDYLPTIENATYTLQLYKGTIGDSELLYSETVLQGSATSSGSFPLTLPTAGEYVLVYTATYPDGMYPLGFHCGGDICIHPHYSLADFQRYMTTGQAESGDEYGDYVPAILGLDDFTIAPPPGPKDSNILFLPGLMESRLYMKDAQGNEQLLWEPTHNADISQLSMTVEGESRNQIYTRDIVDYLYSPFPALKAVVATVAKNISPVYGPFEEFMDSLVQNGTIKEWRAFPYDWRYDVSDIVQNGTLVGTATGTPARVHLQDVVQELASTSPTGQVTIVAHSDGGLLAKALAVDLEKKGEMSLLDKIILVGTPQLGTPSAIGDMLHGDGQTRALGLVTDGSTVRAVAKDMPGAYDLLPSPAYFSYISTPVVSFDDHSAILITYRDKFGDSIDSYNTLSDFLTDAPQLRTSVDDADLRTPNILLPDLLAHAAATHAAIDDWVPPEALSLISITGMGQQTPSGYDYSATPIQVHCYGIVFLSTCKQQSWFSHTATLTSQGDDTVVSISSAGNPGQRLYFDSQSFEKKSGQNIDHQSLLSAAPIQSQILDLLNASSTIEPYVSTATPAYDIIPDTPDLVVSAHSPVDLLATDRNGNQSGIIPIPGTDMYALKQDIPGSSVQIYDDEKYIYLPDADNTYAFAMQGYGIGSTTIEIGRENPDGSVSTLQSFANIPTTASTTGSFVVSRGIAGGISIDVNGDGKTDFVATSSDLSSSSEEEATAPAAQAPSLPPAPSTGQDASPIAQTQAKSADTIATSTDLISYLKLKLLLLELEIKLMKLMRALHLPSM